MADIKRYRDGIEASRRGGHPGVHVLNDDLEQFLDTIDKIDSAVGLLRNLGGMMPGTREVVDVVVDLLTSATED